MTPNRTFVYLVLTSITLLSGCASLSSGVTEAIMNYESEDKRRCWITGRAFTGLEDLFTANTDNQPTLPKKLKVMTVHGIGTHKPGYSRRLLDGLIAELGFSYMDEQVRRIPLAHPEYDGNLGLLSVYRYMNSERTREVLFYELTWDSIVEEQKRIVDFDNGQEASARRVPFNHTMKTFVNQSVPDALIYNTSYRIPIHISVEQTACWMLTANWDDLPHNDAMHCDATRADAWLHMDESDIAIISHSLGSRISIDALQQTAFRVAEDPALREISQQLKNKPVYLYMLSNQLPLLQVGQPLPEVHGQIRSICTATGAQRAERLLQKLQIVAFSDPNDLFSYVVKPSYIDQYIDSRLCPAITNVVIEVAPVTSIFGTEAFANPQAAHTNYEADSRVLKMLISGISQEHGQAEVRERCDFIEAIPDY